MAPLLRATFPLLGTSLVMPLHEPRAHEQYVSRAKLGPLLCSHSFEVVVGNGVTSDWGVLDVTGLGVGEIIEEDGTANNAAVLGPF